MFPDLLIRASGRAYLAPQTSPYSSDHQEWWAGQIIFFVHFSPSSRSSANPSSTSRRYYVLHRVSACHVTLTGDSCFTRKQIVEEQVNMKEFFTSLARRPAIACLGHLSPVEATHCVGL